jgi:acyl-CoA reductase-like NAD-dependent aldehyde dehydrogenase
VAQILAEHPKVDMVSFTGSTPVGRHLHALGVSFLLAYNIWFAGIKSFIHFSLFDFEY